MSDTPQPRRHLLLAWSCALVIGALGTWLLYRHQFASGFDLFPGPRGDTRQTAYVCEHWFQALRGKVNLLSPSIFYPVKGTLGYSDALLAFVPPYSLLRVLGLDIFTALAVVVVAFGLLNFLTGFALLFHGLRLRWLPSVAGAMFFAFNNPKLSLPDNLQLQVVWLLAVTAMCVILFFRDVQSLSAKRAFGLLALAGMALDVQLLTGFYLGWFLIFWSGLLLVLTLPVRRARTVLAISLHRHWRPMLAAAGVAAAGLIPFLIIYLPVVQGVGDWPYRVAQMNIPEISSHLLMADGNFVWSRVTASLLQAAGDPDWGRRVGIGIVPTLTWLGLSMFALKTPTQRPFLAGSILAVNVLILLALQYHGHSLWHKVYEFVPGAKAIRDVGRFMIVAALPMSVAFAVAVEGAQRWIGRRGGPQAMLVALIAFGWFEQFRRGDGDYYSISAENERLQRLAAKLPADCEAFYVTAPRPAGQPLQDFQNQQWMHDAMFVSILRGVPTLNGRSSKSPPGWRLREVTAPDYEKNVRDWILSQKVDGRVCRLEIAD